MPFSGLIVLVLGTVIATANPFNALQSFDFTANGNTEGWTGTNASISAASASLPGTATTGDPQIANDVTDFLGGASNGVLIRIRASRNANAQLFWGITGADNYSGNRVFTVPYSGNGDWQTLLLCPRGHDQWEGKTITRLRFDPPGQITDTFEIDWLRVLSWDYDNDGIPDQIEGTADTNSNGIPDMMDFDSDGDGISDAWENAIQNAPGSVHFDFENSLEGWAVTGGLTVLSTPNGSVNLNRSDTVTPRFTRDRLHLWAGLVNGLIVRIESPVSGSAKLLWTHDAATTYDTSRSITVPVSAGAGAANFIYFDMRNAPGWKGKLITGLRIEPNFPTGTEFSIGMIHTSDGDYDRDRVPDSGESFDDIDSDAIPNFMDTDSDGDGVSDTEEIRRGWNPLDPMESTLDTDGDDFKDTAEIIAGTDPDSANERPQSLIEAVDSGYDVSMVGSPGRSYTLQRSPNLTNWLNTTTVPQVSGNPTLAWRIDDTPPDKEFYRIGISAPMGEPASTVGINPTAEVGSSETAYLDNGTLRLGARVKHGASIDFLAPSGGGSLVNRHDQGRLIQQSYYAGLSLDRKAVGQSPSWSPWPWNPIQGGDAALFPAQVQQVTVAEFGNGFFSRTIPLLWDMTTGEKGQAWMDQWNQFEPGMPHVLRITCRFRCFRDANNIWGSALARHQELPAVYLIRSLSKVVTYKGSSPWTNDATEQVTITPGPPWGVHYPTESWAAMVNPTTNIGVGVFSPIGTTRWYLGATGNPPGGPTSSQTMHMAPIRTMSMDRDSIMVYRYWMIYGNLTTIRSTVYQLNQLYPGG